MTNLASEFVAGLFGALAAAIPVWAIARQRPSRTVRDSVAIVDASGQIIDHLSTEVSRLQLEVAKVRREADEWKTQVHKLERESQALLRRVAQLESAVRVLGGDPETVVSNPDI